MAIALFKVCCRPNGEHDDDADDGGGDGYSICVYSAS